MGLILAGLFGVAPFIFGALVSAGLVPGISSPFTGVLVLQVWGTAFLGLAGGVLLGSAMRTGPVGIILTTICFAPVFWALSVAFWPDAMLGLIVGTVVLQGIEVLIWRLGRIPVSWLGICTAQNAIAIISLIVGMQA